MLRNRLLISLARRSHTIQGGGGPSSTARRPPTPSSSATGQEDITSKVTGLSPNVVKPAAGPVGPGAEATGQYKVPEYFCFDRFSYHEAEVELAKYRCPQPSAFKK